MKRHAIDVLTNEQIKDYIRKNYTKGAIYEFLVITEHIEDFYFSGETYTKEEMIQEYWEYIWEELALNGYNV